ncbi:MULTISPECIES: hypothetical protein [unclassified Flavobacterium]|uniref:hypothetical protein n=1 Tax=unclassified Flavobacterium TaxID=196869 RepID=UPI00095B6D6E|nr:MULTISPECIES: hypothetical protein [unclassified Flavobacterium]MBN9284567.1 hypothetical protein [Flavobacterium sp.]OJV68177.1 MAG: hypothetical protein BGO42_00190 [Flavobacterium sp. 40-81]
MNEDNKKKIALGFILGFAVIFTIIIGVKYLMKPSIDNDLISMSHEVNRKCPVFVDKETRLDNANVLPNKVFQYNYTLVNLVKEQVDVDEAQKVIAPNLINSVKTSPDMKKFRDNNVKLIYAYRDKNGKSLFKIFITPEMYND